jgi:hydroxymethylpyrimidine/phosphomethylpyrimidine kinase
MKPKDALMGLGGGLTEVKIPKVLTIAGSDSGGGAGIQADLKTFSALGCYGMSAISALTAQNTQEVTGIHPVPPEFLEKQIHAVLSDFGADAIKIGMLHSSEIIKVVARSLKKFNVSNVVLDPVMVAKSGDPLLQQEAIAALKELLIPLATVITPNLPEAGILLNSSIDTKEEMEVAATTLVSLGAKAVLIKGGHLQGSDCSNCLSVEDEYQNQKVTWFPAKRVETKNTHGTGCTLSSAIAAFLARGSELKDAVKEAMNYLDGAIQAAKEMNLGQGHGPVHHFHAMWQNK